MATRRDRTDRNGKSYEMKQRSIRLTDNEDMMINMLLKKSGMNLRDLIVYLVEKELV